MEQQSNTTAGEETMPKTRELAERAKAAVEATRQLNESGSVAEMAKELALIGVGVNTYAAHVKQTDTIGGEETMPKTRELAERAKAAVKDARQLNESGSVDKMTKELALIGAGVKAYAEHVNQTDAVLNPKGDGDKEIDDFAQQVAQRGDK